MELSTLPAAHVDIPPAPSPPKSPKAPDAPPSACPVARTARPAPSACPFARLAPAARAPPPDDELDLTALSPDPLSSASSTALVVAPPRRRCPWWVRVLRFSAKYVARQVVMRTLKSTLGNVLSALRK